MSDIHQAGHARPNALAGQPSKPLFQLGAVVATPGALHHCAQNGTNPATLIRRHHCGDWGDTGDFDKQANNDALAHGGRLFSVYIVADEKLYVLTEWDRSVTTLLRSQDY